MADDTPFDLHWDLALAPLCPSELRRLGCRTYPSGVFVPESQGDPSPYVLRCAQILGFTERSARLERIHAQRGEPGAVLTNPKAEAHWLGILCGSVKAYPNDGCREHALHNGYGILMGAARDGTLRALAKVPVELADREMDTIFDALGAAEAVAQVACEMSGACAELWDHLLALVVQAHAQAVAIQEGLDTYGAAQDETIGVEDGGSE